MRAALLSLALLAGCATQHIHHGDCIGCLGPTLLQIRVANQVQTQEIYKVVGKAIAAVTSGGRR